MKIKQKKLNHSSGESIKIPFTLQPSSQNEIEYLFNATDCTFPHKIKGSMTYMVKSSNGSTHEKLDFKLSFPCSVFLIESSCDG